MKSRFLPVILSLLLLPGCVVYKIDIQQGNEVSAEMLSQLKIGMSKDEVVKVIGYPLINDPFHADRWDYYFYLKKGKTGKVEQQSATLHFDGDSLMDIKSSLIEANAGE